MTKTRADEYWDAFLVANPQIGRDAPYLVWYFGNTIEMATELAELVISGKKSATASLAKMNELEPEKAPIENGYSVVTDFEGAPMCIIQTAEIRHLPFNEVDANFAFDEGEGDQSLYYWRSVHWDYFAREAAEHGFDFDETSIVCCERFRLLFPK
ncbi:MAG: ASCH domain-containing protein [Pyrinomonadaceae bacterium]